MNITDKQAPYVEEMTRKLNQHGIRAKSDLRNEKIGFKIREHTIEHVPYLLIVGDREVESNTVSIRTQEGADLGSMSPSQFIELINAEIMKRGQKE